MNAYQNIERVVRVLPEAEREAKELKLTKQLDRLKNSLAYRMNIKGFKKINPKSINTYEARLTRQYRAYLIFDGDTPVVIRVGDHLQ